MAAPRNSSAKPSRAAAMRSSWSARCCLRMPVSTAPCAPASAASTRLGTDHLDLYLLHWKGRYPIAETMRAMERLIDQRQIRFAGVSNFEVAEVEAAQAALRNHRLASNQVLYHLRERGIERKLIPYCEAAPDRGRGLHALRPRSVSAARFRRRQSAGRNRGAQRPHRPAGHPELPHALPPRLHHSEGRAAPNTRAKMPEAWAGRCPAKTSPPLTAPSPRRNPIAPWR